MASIDIICNQQSFKLERDERVICRICGGKTNENINLYSHEQQIFRVKCQTCLPICFSEDDTLSKWICEECPVRVNEIFDFFERIVEATRKQLTLLDSDIDVNTYIRSYLPNNAPSLDDIKLETDHFESHVFNYESPSSHIEDKDDKNEDVPDTNLILNRNSERIVEPRAVLCSSKQRVTSKRKPTRRNRDRESVEKDGCSNEDFNMHQDDQIFDVDYESLDEEGDNDLTFPEMKVENEKTRGGREQEANSFINICSTCKKVFKTAKMLLKHEGRCLSLSSKAARFHCDLCNRKFNSDGNLNAHLRTHEGLMPYQCEICFKTFGQKSNLESHHLSHTGERPYICELCGMSYKRPAELKMHARTTHYGEKPFNCSHCHKRFHRRDLLNKHERIHTNTRPYGCQYCEKRFVQRDKMVVHERLHTGERPYTCVVCSKGFCESGNLKKHMKVHQKVFDKNQHFKTSSSPSSLSLSKNHQSPSTSSSGGGGGEREEEVGTSFRKISNFPPNSDLNNGGEGQEHNSMMRCFEVQFNSAVATSTERSTSNLSPHDNLDSPS